ncbi:ABC transporter ATP-binding protein [Paenalkalicoccus suaedae]|uniref:ABC transporter ATP-binding protein n=1 Tax=Paenalkalicoccus suaedae TaxID=2592382 RepID=A0A859FBZ7_9BACI|nr:ABC transporter ATP-binding protein [Paenalkalicoccus suaedae]QKS70074.1 ABC transporter ATP-binding protein [Paenalkalicoccus suaedae]
MQNAIEVNNLAKMYGETQSLKHVSFEVKQGEIFGYLGPSGSGKTTTLKILTGQLIQTKGDVTVLGATDQKLRSASFLKEIGVMTDNSGLYERLTIQENLQLFATLYEVKQAKARISEVLTIVGLEQEHKKAIKSLSKGMRQRVILARTLLHKPTLLFLDEPTAALDPASKQHIHDGLRELNKQGTTIFLTTHDMQEAQDLCDRTAILHEGAIVELGNPKDICRKYADNVIEIELKDGTIKQLPLSADSAQEVYQVLSEGKVEAISSIEPSLGEVFIKLTGRKLA